MKSRKCISRCFSQLQSIKSWRLHRSYTLHVEKSASDCKVQMEWPSYVLPSNHSSHCKRNPTPVSSFFHCQHASKTTSHDKSIVVCSSDTSALVILLFYNATISCNLLFDTGTGNNRRFLNVKTIAKTIRKAACKALIALHAFTGCIHQLICPSWQGETIPDNGEELAVCCSVQPPWSIYSCRWRPYSGN